MLSIKQQKLIRSLQHKKYRDIHSLFLIEGEKTISDLLHSGELTNENLLILCSTEDWYDGKKDILKNIQDRIIIADNEEIRKLSTMHTPPKVFAVVKIPGIEYKPKVLRDNITIVLDEIRDPGNFGSIIRTADWFGIHNIVCSPDSVDQYNSKVVQSSMGAILRTNIHYKNLHEFFTESVRMKIPIYGTTLDGNNLYDTSVKNPGIIVFGNESRGINKDYHSFFNDEICIPDYPSGKSITESLNIAMSVGIVCSEIRRRGR